jgi:hypothetical protein
MISCMMLGRNLRRYDEDRDPRLPSYQSHFAALPVLSRHSKQGLRDCIRPAVGTQRHKWMEKQERLEESD